MNDKDVWTTIPVFNVIYSVSVRGSALAAGLCLPQHSSCKTCWQCYLGITAVGLPDLKNILNEESQVIQNCFSKHMIIALHAKISRKPVSTKLLRNGSYKIHHFSGHGFTLYNFVASQS